MDNNFIGKIFEQNCGDSLLVLEKSETKRGKDILYRCVFQKYPMETLRTKSEILKGKCTNPEIENHEFIGKVFSQNCGDSLKVIESIIEKGIKKFRCIFHKYLYEVIADKTNIKGEMF